MWTPFLKKEKKVGALIVDPCKEGICVSKEDFEYRKVGRGQLIGSAGGQGPVGGGIAWESYRKREAILMETAHNFRNRTAVIESVLETHFKTVRRKVPW